MNVKADVHLLTQAENKRNWRVAVTGSAGCLGSVLIRRLCEDVTVDEVVGIDARPSTFSHTKYRHIIQDVRASDLHQHFEGFDALVHLAFVIVGVEKHAREEMISVNVGGSQHVFESARIAKVRKIVNLSSVSVYGSGSQIHEDAPLNPTPGFHYAEDKAALEQVIASRFPEIINLRSHLIVGKNAMPFVMGLFDASFYFKIFGRKARMQVIHDSDVAAAIMLAMRSQAVGSFNIAAQDDITLETLCTKGKKRKFPVPYAPIKKFIEWADFLDLPDETIWAKVLNTNLTVDTSKAHRELNWQPRYSCLEARDH